MDLAISNLGIPTGLAGWDILQKQTPASFPAFMNDPVLKREIAYFEQNAPKATTAKALLANPQLQDFALTAFGLTAQEGMNGLMQKVLNSAPGSTTSFAAQMVSSQYQAIATAFNYGGTVTPAVPATPSSAQITVGDLSAGSSFSTFSGTFAGITLSNLDLTGVTTWQGLASTLQSAFRRADGNRSNISVSLNGLNLTFTDAQGRGTATSFAWTNDPLNTGSGPTVSSPQDLAAGAPAQAAQGGPAVTNPAFIKQVVQAYTEAQFQAVVGNSSNALRQALYAKQQLPSVTNWDSVIADRNLADVVQTVLGLPQSFGALNITQQAQVFSSRMNIANFQNPTKLNKMLDQFVAMSQAQSQSSTQTPALQLLSSSSGSNGVINLTLPNSSSLPDSYSSASASAMLLNTANG